MKKLLERRGVRRWFLGAGLVVAITGLMQAITGAEPAWRDERGSKSGAPAFDFTIANAVPGHNPPQTPAATRGTLSGNASPAAFNPTTQNIQTLL